MFEKSTSRTPAIDRGPIANGPSDRWARVIEALAQRATQESDQRRL